MTTPREVADFPPGLLAIPAMEWMFTPSVRAITHLVSCLPHGSAVHFMEGMHSIAHKRNALARSLLATPTLQWVLFLDADAVPPPDAALRLLRRDVDIVAATYYMRIPPHGRSAPRPDPHAPDALIEVPSTGCHCILVRRRVLERVPFPWFEHPEPGSGEDSFFCAKVRQHGFRVLVDPTLEAGHMSSVNITGEYAAAYQQTPSGKRLIQEYIGRGKLVPHAKAPDGGTCFRNAPVPREPGAAHDGA